MIIKLCKNTKKPIYTLLLALVYCTCSIIKPAYSETIQTLIDSNRLQIETTLNQEGKVTVREPIILSIEVATDRWFARGSRPAPLSIKDVVVPPASDLAINGNRRINGKTWVTQTREIVMYPTKAGPYLVPELAIDLSINTEQGIVEGIAYTKAREFIAELPEELQGLENFVVSPELNLDIEGEFDSNTIYRVGDAISQTITLSAEDTPAMMLPEFNLPKPGGMSIYEKPDEVVDKSSRGSLTGIRRETRVYIFESIGDFRIPEQKIHWWNSETEELIELRLKEQSWQVERAAFSWKTLASFTDWQDALTKSLALMTALAFLFYLTKKYSVILQFIIRWSRWPQRRLKQQYFSAVKANHFPLACQLLYKIYALPYENIDNLRERLAQDPECLALLNKLYTLGFSRSNSTVEEFSKIEARRLINPTKNRIKTLNLDKRLLLNP